MDQSSFASTSPGRLVGTLNGERAFVPSPLPPKIDLGQIALKMGTALQAIGELKGACRRLQNPYILVRPLQRNEALTSSAMEGTFTTEDSLLLLAAGVSKDSDEQTREVANYLTALSESLDLLKSLPISHRVLKAAHRSLLDGLSLQRGARKHPGEYKREQNWIGGATIEEARFVPPPPAEAQSCMDELEAYINRENNIYPPPIIDLALVHYQLETIHPFADGNGRVGRMLVSLMAVHNGLLEMPALYLSPVLERYKDKYIDLLFNISLKGEWENWLNFFFSVVQESCLETIETIDRLILLQDGLKTLAAKSTRSSNVLAIIDDLFVSPVITIPEAARKVRVTYAAAKNTIERLQEIGILRPLEGSYPMAFYAPSILQASRPQKREAIAQKDLFDS